MTYQVYFTDRINKPTPITVTENTVDATTDLKFLGKNSQNYGSIVAENFLHLLENFANTSAPNNPIQGQLWFDTNSGVTQLKVNVDGTANGWAPAGGIKRSNTPPDTTNSVIGDLWANTNTQQLFLFTGTTWSLVGPEYSRSGSKPEIIPDTTEVDRFVVSIYIEGDRVAVISKNEFTPRIVIPGFPSIKAGVNLNTNYNTYWGTAEKATALVVGSTVVSASHFLRNDAVSNTVFPINVKTPLGITVGESSEISLAVEGPTGTLSNRLNQGGLAFNVNSDGIFKTVLFVDGRQRVGINKLLPEAALDINGNVQVSDTVNIRSTQASTSSTTGALTVAGGVGISGDLRVAGAITFGTDIVLGNNRAVLPDVNNGATIGSNLKKFQTVYANTFEGGIFRGQFESSTVIEGSARTARQLYKPTRFSLAGDVVSDAVEFDGLVLGASPFETKIFNTNLSEGFIAQKPEILTLEENDEFVVSRGTAGLKKVKKSTMWDAISRNPAGSIIAFAGPSAPVGWLLCDGSEVLISAYPLLFQVIQYIYGDLSTLNGTGTFKLPDLRGRFSLGLDNMNNSMTVPSKVDPRVQISAGGGSANRVTDSQADNIGLGAGAALRSISLENLPDHEHNMQGNAGNQYYAYRNISGTPADTNAVSGQGSTAPGLGQYLASSGGVLTAGSLGSAMNIMNPYLALNYIIYTGRDI